MDNTYLDLPLRFDGSKFKNTSLSDSITKLVSIIISTPKGSVFCDREFGTDQLDPDEALVEMETLKEDLAKTIKSALERSEPRLGKISVKIQGGMKPDKTGILPLKIIIGATEISTGKAFKLEKTLTEDYYRTPFPGRMG
ncbi:MAG: GPW/gp25 family protein [Candidatus Zixiibacteriota bacterium]|nr:MAG: GPW/gp25 family protein [candidate division Zixibacteria bacterium]